VKWVSKKSIRESISHNLDSGEDSQILEKNRKEKKQDIGEQRKKEGKMRSSHPQTLPPSL
jgi:hypothetical protein